MKGMNNMIPVAEIFGPTIQGEGPNTGKKSLFVRVVGCDFNCEWCDSKFAWKPDNDTIHYDEYALAERLTKLCYLKNTFQIVLTGGNPCLYDFEYIIDQLHSRNIKVDIETQGSRLPEWLKNVDLLVISPKAPSSKQPDVMDNIYKYVSSHRTQPIAIKIPVFDDADFEFATKYYEKFEEFDNVKLYINVGNDNTQEKGDISQRLLLSYAHLIEKVCKSEMTNVYVMPQLHTLVWR